MTHRPIGADDVSGELPAVVETRIQSWIDDGDAPKYPNIEPSGDTTGVTDTAAIQANEDAGLNTVLTPGATYYVKGLVKKSNCSIYVNDATIALPHGANVDVIISENFTALTGTGGTGGIFNACIYGPGEINGSKFWSTLPKPTVASANFNMSGSFSLQLSSTAGLGSTGSATISTQSGPQNFTWSANDTGTNTLTCSSSSTGRVLTGTPIFLGGYGIRIYGYNIDIGGSLLIHECDADGVWTEWAPSASVGSTTPEMESRLGPFKTYENGRNGYSYLGPHDSYVNHVVAFRNKNKGIVAANGSIGYFTNCHGWGAPQVIGLEDHTGSTWVDCVGEMTSASGSRGWGIWSNQTVTRGCIALWAGSGGNVGLEIENNASGCDIDMKFVGGFGNGAVKFTTDGGKNIIRGIVNGLGANPMTAGTPAASDIIDLVPGVSTSTVRYTQNVVTTADLAAEAALARNADNLSSGTVADARIASTIARDTEVTAAVAAEATLARNGDNITSGTVADARIAATIARDSEVAAAVAVETAARVADVDAEESARIAAVAAEAALARDAGNLTSGTVADARIPSGITRDTELILPADLGFAGWAFDPAVCASQTAPASGAIKYVRVKATDTRNVTGLWVGVGTLGSGLTSGQCLMALYDSTGQRLALSADQSGVWNSTGIKTATIASTAVVAGAYYYIGILAVGSTPPAFARGYSAVAAIANAGIASAPFRFNNGATSQTTLPSSFTPSGTTAELAYWVGMA